jgi:hypothetical protein
LHKNKVAKNKKKYDIGPPISMAPNAAKTRYWFAIEGASATIEIESKARELSGEYFLARKPMTINPRTNVKLK